MKNPLVVFSFITGPIRTELSKDGRTILTHLQKFSHFWIMLTYPLCFHFGLMFKLQEKEYLGSNEYRWFAGTERGLYFRFNPLALAGFLFHPWWVGLCAAVLIQIVVPAYRWDYDLGMKKTKGYFGFHLD